uniref:UBX domain-containing protein n=1 Tax=Arcella intermedia TaxID=1963864 RepID=A0A6B2LB53_9EUKA
MSREQNINYLVEMGFPRELAAEAIKINGYVEPSIAWCIKKQQSEIGYSLGGTGPTGQALGGGGAGNTLGGAGQTLGGGGGQTLGGESGHSVHQDVVAPPEEVKHHMTEAEREAAMQRIKERIAEKKRQDEIDNERSELEKEKMRRVEGKEAQAAKEAWAKAEAEREAMIKKRDKERERLAKEKVREQIRIDQINREAEEKKRKGETVPQQQAPVAKPPSEEPKKEYSSCVIQIRMPDNSRIEHTFPITSTVRDVLTFVMQNRKDGKANRIQLSTTFPKKSYTESNLGTTLKDADMVPRGLFMASYI